MSLKAMQVNFLQGIEEKREIGKRKVRVGRCEKNPGSRGNEECGAKKKKTGDQPAAPTNNARGLLGVWNKKYVAFHSAIRPALL
jgi:hypothetical protein